jgi:hypothetical protein
MQPRQALSILGGFTSLVKPSTSHRLFCRALTRRLTAHMSLVSGPGRGGIADTPREMRLAVDSHVRYIQSLDTVRTL